MSQESNQRKTDRPGRPCISRSTAIIAGLAAWTEIEDGRFMPRRVRGSCQGRALGLSVYRSVVRFG